MRVLLLIALSLLFAGPARADKPIDSVKRRMIEACEALPIGEPAEEARKHNCYAYTHAMFFSRKEKNWEGMAYWLALLHIMVPEIVEVEWNRD